MSVTSVTNGTSVTSQCYQAVIAGCYCTKLDLCKNNTEIVIQKLVWIYNYRAVGLAWSNWCPTIICNNIIIYKYSPTLRLRLD